MLFGAELWGRALVLGLGLCLFPWIGESLFLGKKYIVLTSVGTARGKHTPLPSLPVRISVTPLVL